MRGIFSLTLVVVFFFLLNSCQKNDGPSNGDSTLDQTAFLNNMGENLIVEGYTDFEEKTMALLVSTQSFQSGPDLTTLQDLRNKWKEAYLSWQNVAFYNFGPAETSGIITINYYPTDTTLIKNNISSGDYNLGTAGNTFAKGFPALDYLLFETADTDEAIVNYFSLNDNAVAYVVDLANNIHSLADQVLNNWSPEGSNYLATFVNNKGTSSGSSLSLLVNAWSQYMETHVRSAKIGTPNGNSVATSEKFGPFPEKAEAYYAMNATKDLLKTTNEALKNFYLGINQQGADGIGIYDLLVELNSQNGTLADDYKDLFIDVDNKIGALSGTWIENMATNGEKVTEIFNQYKALVALLKVDIVSALSISITYSDNDGD